VRSESPFYLFDRSFSEKLSATDLPPWRDSLPAWFRHERGGCGTGHRTDLLERLGKGARPDYEWLIAGPSQSGSAFHIDPNCTHAWNMPLVGDKLWIFYPPGVPPPGVVVESGGDEVGFARAARGADPAGAAALLRRERGRIRGARAERARRRRGASGASKKKEEGAAAIRLSVSHHGRASAGCGYPSLIMGSLEEEGAAAVAAAAALHAALLRQERVESRAVGGRPPEPPLRPARSH
jgi:hypothetical protein